MDSIARRELVVAGLLILLVGALLFPALQHARREYRDGVRRTEIAERKRQLEQYFNAHETYPLTFNAAPHEYIVTNSDGRGATGWYVRAQLENPASTTSGFDYEEGHNFYWRITNDEGRTLYEVCGGTLHCETNEATTSTP